jgi:hypothetical protein
LAHSFGSFSPWWVGPVVRNRSETAHGGGSTGCWPPMVAVKPREEGTLRSQYPLQGHTPVASLPPTRPNPLKVPPPPNSAWARAKPSTHGLWGQSSKLQYPGFSFCYPAAVTPRPSRSGHFPSRHGASWALTQCCPQPLNGGSWFLPAYACLWWPWTFLLHSA